MDLSSKTSFRRPTLVVQISDDVSLSRPRWLLESGQARRKSTCTDPRLSTRPLRASTCSSRTGASSSCASPPTDYACLTSAFAPRMPSSTTSLRFVRLLHLLQQPSAASRALVNDIPIAPIEFLRLWHCILGHLSSRRLLATIRHTLVLANVPALTPDVVKAYEASTVTCATLSFRSVPPRQHKHPSPRAFEPPLNHLRQSGARFVPSIASSSTSLDPSHGPQLNSATASCSVSSARPP
jgi:hypothetical protein